LLELERHMTTKKESGVRRAVAALGGQVKTAEKMDVTQQAVSAWVRRGYLTRVERALKLAQASGVPAADLVSKDVAKLMTSQVA
jgi:predicted transcriptional regulator